MLRENVRGTSEPRNIYTKPLALFAQTIVTPMNDLSTLLSANCLLPSLY